MKKLLLSSLAALCLMAPLAYADENSPPTSPNQAVMQENLDRATLIMQDSIYRQSQYLAQVHSPVDGNQLRIATMNYIGVFSDTLNSNLSGMIATYPLLQDAIFLPYLKAINGSKDPVAGTVSERDLLDYLKVYNANAHAKYKFVMFDDANDQTFLGNEDARDLFKITEEGTFVFSDGEGNFNSTDLKSTAVKVNEAKQFMLQPGKAIALLITDLKGVTNTGPFALRLQNNGKEEVEINKSVVEYLDRWMNYTKEVVFAQYKIDNDQVKAQQIAANVAKEANKKGSSISASNLKISGGNVEIKGGSISAGSINISGGNVNIDSSNISADKNIDVKAQDLEVKKSELNAPEVKVDAQRVQDDGSLNKVDKVYPVSYKETKFSFPTIVGINGYVYEVTNRQGEMLTRPVLPLYLLPSFNEKLLLSKEEFFAKADAILDDYPLDSYLRQNRDLYLQKEYNNYLTFLRVKGAR